MTTQFAQIPLPVQEIDPNEELQRRIEFLRSKKEREERVKKDRKQSNLSQSQPRAETLEGNLILDSKGFAQTSNAKGKKDLRNLAQRKIQYSVGGGFTQSSQPFPLQPFHQSLPAQTATSPYLQQNLLEGGSKLLEAFNPKHGVTLRAGNILKRGEPETSSPRTHSTKVTSHTLPVMRQKMESNENNHLNPIIKLTPKILKKNKALTASKLQQGIITIHSDFAAALHSPIQDIHREQRSYIPTSKVPNLGLQPLNERRVSSPIETTGIPKLPVLPPSTHQFTVPMAKSIGYGKMKIEDGRVARAIPGADEIKRERKSRMMYGNSLSKKLRRGQSHHI